MAKKRKASSRHETSVKEAEFDPRDSRKRIRTFEDVADSDDEFHLNNDEIQLAEAPEVKRRRRWAEQEEFLQPSDEEVLGDSDDDNESVGEESKSFTAEHALSQGVSDRLDEDEDELGWGTTKADIYGADAIETEEQAIEEEAEALRLQKKQLESMNAADYGFDEADWHLNDRQDTVKSNKTGGRTVTEILPHLQIPPELGSAERLKILSSRYPEFVPLKKDLMQVMEEHSRLIKAGRTDAVSRTKLRAASAYVGALAMYFSLLASPASSGEPNPVALATSQLREHPVMDSLIACRTLWQSVTNLSESVPKKDDERFKGVKEMVMAEEWNNTSVRDEIQVLDQVTAPRIGTDSKQEAAERRKTERRQRMEADLEGLEDMLSSHQRKVAKQRHGDTRELLGSELDLGEELPLTAQEAEDKAKRKKSLRFYASQISQKANKRGAAGRNTGGDDDIPYRERLKDRQARLNAEAEKRGRRDGAVGAELDGESDEEDRRQAQELRDDALGDDYYDLVAARTAKKKGDRVALAMAQRDAAMRGGHIIEEETVDADGKRKISYAIEKNKGLTPHRKKDVRNPRVKKRKKFDEKKKKLASIKPVYKGGEGRGGYGGELTGIKKGLIKSTRL